MTWVNRLTIAIGVVAALVIAIVVVPSATAHEGHASYDASQAPWQGATKWPDRIVATFEGDPTTSFAVSWRTDASVARTEAEFVLSSGVASFDFGATKKEATTEALDIESARRAWSKMNLPGSDGLVPTHYHSVRFDGLLPNTLYAYRVRGADGIWSEWFQIRTAPQRGAFKFIYVGDAQNGILSHWSRTIRAALLQAPDARFIIHAGDLVNRGSRDLEWAEWFKAIGFIHGMIPAIPVPGNHEYDATTDAEPNKRLLTALWRPQFRLNVEPGLPVSLAESAYKIAYNADLDIFVLDTQSEELAVQATWLDAELTKSRAKWKIVTMHHPIFSSGDTRDSPSKRAILLPILNKHKVDLVLQGHDHTYARGVIPARPAVAGRQRPVRSASGTGEAIDTMFVNSVSGPKQYNFKKNGWDEYAPTGVRLERFGEGAQFFQVIEINDDKLDYRAYAATGELYDSFGLTKDRAGLKRLIAGPTPTLPQFRFSPQTPDRPYRDPK